MRKQLGVILPTTRSIHNTTLYARENKKIKETIEKKLFKSIKNCDVKIVDGEKRHYSKDNPLRFAIVGSIDHDIKWFEHRGNDIYAIKK